jgi:hypothetical protein
MKTKLENNMEAIFDLPEAPAISNTNLEEVEILPPEAHINTTEIVDETIDIDVAYARDNMYKIIETGNQSLEVLIDVARASESPRAFEVVQQFMKTLAETNKDLLELQRKKKILKNETEEAPKSVTNALFVGSTAELQKMLKDMNSK